MDRIVSGTTPGRIVRTVLLTVMFGGYAGWSIFDGYVGYPRGNVEAAIRTKLGLTETEAPAVLPSSITQTQIASIEPGTARAGVLEQLGAPGLEHDGQLYYFGDGGFATIEMRGGAVRSARWTDGPAHSRASIGFQKLIGFALLPVALAMLVQLVRVLRTRAVLTEDDLKIGRGRAIPLESITQVRQIRSDCFDLTHTRDGKTRTVCLDGYVIAQAEPMVRAICAHNHLPEPNEASAPTSPK